MGCTPILSDEFLNIQQERSPVIRTEYVEVQEIDRSMHMVTKVGKKWLPVTAQVIPGVTLPLLMV